MHPSRPLTQVRWLLITALLFGFPHQAEAEIRFGVGVAGPSEPVPATGPVAAPRVAEVLIDFDDVFAPCVFGETTPLRDQYLLQGVRFLGGPGTDGGAILNACGNFSVTGYSGTNFLAFNGIAPPSFESDYNPALPEEFLFTVPVAAVSVRAGSGLGPGLSVQLRAFSSANVLVASSALTLTPALQLISVSAPGIVRVQVAGPTVMVMDDLRFTPGSVVPVLAKSWGQVKTVYR